MGTIRIATSGYYYRDWVGPVYPPGTDSRHFLELYSRMFDWTEINATYYRQPEPARLKTMLRTATAMNPGFSFSIKAHRSLTHEHSPDVSTQTLQRNTEIFQRGLEPLVHAGALDAVLLQFPYSFHYTTANRRRLDILLQRLAELPLVVEFRGSDWNRDSVLKGLQQRGITLAVVDQPSLRGLFPSRLQQHQPTAPAMPTPTQQLCYVRLHGRNADSWWSGTNVSRYDYLYPEQELRNLVAPIRQLQSLCHILLIAFNNHAGGKAVRNARQLQQLLRQSNVA